MEKVQRFVIMLVCCLSLTGCITHRDIPLTEGAVPYALKPGVYEDINGNLHNEQKVRWSISEADLFRDTQELSQESPKLGTIRGLIRDYGDIFLLLVLIFVLVRRK